MELQQFWWFSFVSKALYPIISRSSWMEIEDTLEEKRWWKRLTCYCNAMYPLINGCANFSSTLTSTYCPALLALSMVAPQMVYDGKRYSTISYNFRLLPLGLPCRGSFGRFRATGDRAGILSRHGDHRSHRLRLQHREFQSQSRRSRLSFRSLPWKVSSFARRKAAGASRWTKSPRQNHR